MLSLYLKITETLQPQMIPLQSEDFVFCKPKQTLCDAASAGSFQHKGLQIKSPGFRIYLNFLFWVTGRCRGRQSTQSIQRWRVTASPFSCSRRKRTREPANALRGLRGSLQFNPIVFQRQPPGGKQRKHPSADAKSDCLQTQRLSKNNHTSDKCDVFARRCIS